MKNAVRDESFRFVEYSADAAERIGYSNYSYWRAVFQNFMKKRSAVVMAFVFFAIVIFTFIATDPPPQQGPADGQQHRGRNIGDHGDEGVFQHMFEHDAPRRHALHPGKPYVVLVQLIHHVPDLRQRGSRTGVLFADPDVRRPGAASAIPVFRQRVAADQHPAGGVPGPGLHRQLRPLDPPPPSTSLIRGSNSIIITSPRKTPRMPSPA